LDSENVGQNHKKVAAFVAAFVAEITALGGIGGWACTYSEESEKVS